MKPAETKEIQVLSGSTIQTGTVELFIKRSTSRRVTFWVRDIRSGGHPKAEYDPELGTLRLTFSQGVGQNT